jgi:glutathione S-transferase
MLEGQDFVMGSQPTLADFSIYHSVWFTVVKVPLLGWYFGRHTFGESLGFTHGRLLVTAAMNSAPPMR